MSRAVDVWGLTGWTTSACINEGGKDMHIIAKTPNPEGYALIPEGMELPDTFPYVNVTVEGNVVTSMTAGTVPEEKPKEYGPSAQEQLRADVDFIAAMTGVSL